MSHEKKLSRWAHGELTVTMVVTAPGPMITVQWRLGEVTAQSRLGHSSVTARLQLNHGIFSMITAQSRLGHSSITAQVTAQSRLAVNILVTVSSPWAHGEQSWWPIFFSWYQWPHPTVDWHVPIRMIPECDGRQLLLQQDGGNIRSTTGNCSWPALIFTIDQWPTNSIGPLYKM